MGVSLGRKNRRNRGKEERRKVHERQIEGEKDVNGDVESTREEKRQIEGRRWRSDFKLREKISVEGIKR